jgi:aminoglycoside phosphotransferase (APT) family kinase protein
VLPEASLRALAARLSGDPGAPVGFLGEGWDHVVWSVGDALVLRVRKDGTVQEKAVAVQHDVDVLHFAARHSPVTAPEVRGVAPLDGALLTTRVAGVPAAEAQPDLPALADALAELLTALHSVPPDEARDVVGPDPDAAEDWLRQVEDEYAEARAHCPADLRAGIEAFLAAPPPAPGARLVFCHNDVRDDHVLVDPGTGRVTGLIDWSDAVLGDPALDLATVLTDFGAPAYERVLDGYGGPVEEGLGERVRHVARRRMVEDLAWCVRTGDAAGLARTARVLRRLL